MTKLPEIFEEVEPDPEAPPDKGWYTYCDGKRFWDGERWTDHYAPPEPEPISYWKIAEAVAGGVVIGWFLIWLGAQVAPDVFYWPVKFVVEELPEGF